MVTVDLKFGTIYHDGLEIGHVKFKINGQTAEVHDIWLMSRYRGKGFGRQVNAILESEFRRQGCRRVEGFRVLPEGFPFAKTMGYTVVRGSGAYKHMAKTL
jgi:ribosomal protein S18 acetylase RimI-like enzyme